MPQARFVSAAQAAALAGETGRIFLSGCAGEPDAILDAVAADAALWPDHTLTGAFIPGVNQRDYSALGEKTIVETIFMTPAMMPSAASGAVSHLPLHYSDYWRRLADPGLVDIAYLQVPPPGPDGTIGLGAAADFAMAPISAGAKLVGVVNPCMPNVATGPRVPLERFEALVEDDRPLPIYDAGTPDPATMAIADHVVSVLDPRDTMQLGLGKVQSAVLQQLAQSGLKGLGFHGGMISKPFLAACEHGVFSRGTTTGVALGDVAFYEWIARQKSVSFSSVGQTHSQTTLASIERFVSVNSVIEVDLLGQANGESIKGKQISGHGGMVDFVRGARISPGGRSILALSATASAGKISRIVPGLQPGTPISVARADVDMVITEYGIAELRNASADTRAQRLIAIAAPHFRDELAQAWDLARGKSGRTP